MLKRLRTKQRWWRQRWTAPIPEGTWVRVDGQLGEVVGYHADFSIMYTIRLTTDEIVHADEDTIEPQE